MPLTNLSKMLPFLSASSPAASKSSPVAPKEQPTLRICFPLRIQRGANSWWEYEEFRVQFRDRVMWRQAFGLDEEDSRETSLHETDQFERRGESSKAGGRNAANNDDDPAFKSRWSYSTSLMSSNIDKHLSDESVSSKTSSQRLKQLMTRMLSGTSSSSQSNKSSASIREVSQLFTSSFPSSKRSTEQHQPLRPEPLNLPLRQMHSLDSDAKEASGTDETQRHRNDALRTLEGESHTGNKEMSFSTFRNMFRLQKTQGIDVISPVIRTVPPVQSKATPQDQKTIGISSEAWANLRDDILGGLMGDTDGIFPFYAESQKAMVMPVEQIDNCFRVRTPAPKEGIQRVGLKAALESIEAGNWKDVIFVSYNDTPREMKWWYTTREPRVLQWGGDML